MLNPSFLPDEATEQLRTFCRHRLNLIDKRSSTNQRIQKYLKLLNLRLDIVVNDIAGLTGMKIIRAIIAGEADPNVLAEHRHHNCKKSKSEIAKALVSNNRADYLFCLEKEVKLFDFLNSQIEEIEQRIALQINNYINCMPEVVDDLPSRKKHKRSNKNSIKTIDLNIASYQYFGGVDLLDIPGVSYSTVLSIMSELGPEGINKFPTAKQFASWLRLALNNKISGGKILSSKVPRGSNRLKIALRNSAYSISRLKDCPLNKFYKKMAFKKLRKYIH